MKNIMLMFIFLLSSCSHAMDAAGEFKEISEASQISECEFSDLMEDVTIDPCDFSQLSRLSPEPSDSSLSQECLPEIFEDLDTMSSEPTDAPTSERDFFDRYEIIEEPPFLKNEADMLFLNKVETTPALFPTKFMEYGMSRQYPPLIVISTAVMQQMIAEQTKNHPLKISPEILKTYIKTDGERPRCKCGQTLIDQHVFKEHVRIVHLQDRPFLCSVCNYDFSLLWNLKKHLRRCHLDCSALVNGPKMLTRSSQKTTDF